MRTRCSTLLLSVLVLSFGASTLFAQAMSVAPTSVSLTYTKAAEGTVAQTATVYAPTDNTAYTATTAANWLTITTANGLVAGPMGDSNPGTGPDTLTVTLNDAVADTMTPGPYTATVTIASTSLTSATLTVNLTLNGGTSPLTVGAVNLSFIKSGTTNQAAATVSASVTDANTTADTFSVGAISQTWLTAVATSTSASSTHAGTVVFTVTQSGGNGLSAGSTSATVHLAVPYYNDLVVTVNLLVLAQQPLVSSVPSLSFTYVSAGSVPVAQTATITAAGAQAFTVDPATVPVWLTASPTSGTANTGGGGQVVTFTPVSAVLKTLNAGNYSATVGFLATGTTVELTVPMTLSVTNATATISVKGSNVTSVIGTNDGTNAAVPVPVTTILSSNEPIAFNATCAVTTTYSVYVQSGITCQMTGASTEGPSVSAIAYTYGTPLTTVLDPTLFNSSTPFGTVIQLTVTAQAVTQSGTPSGSPVSQTFTYTIEPNVPTLTAISPTSAAVIASNTSLVVTLTGTNFVGPGSINVNSSLAPTQVFVGSTNVTQYSVVSSPTILVVSIPAADLPSSVTAGHPSSVVVGVNNQTAGTVPAAPATGATETLTVTANPVIYAITSTASYNQPAPGGHPHLAPFELISIFGANFGVTSSVTGTLSSNAQFPTSITLSGSGSTAVNLSVSFKVGTNTYPAPILFANGTQINAAVPSALTNGQTATVTVTSGTAASDGLFAVNVVTADPGIFTLSSDGTGQGAILNSDYSVNGTGNGAAASDFVSIYMTGLGYPNSTAYDVAGSGNVGTGYPSSCVLVNQTVTANQTTEPGYLQVVNTKATGYTPPTTPWTNIDGAVIQGSLLLGHSMAPCFTAVTATAVTVTFGTGGSAVVASGSSILYAGFAAGSVAGLYQINVTVPGTLTPGTYPVQVTLGTEGSSQSAVVTMVVKAAIQ